MSVALSAPDGSSGQLEVNGSLRLKLRADALLEGVAHPATGDRTAVLATMRKFQDEFPAVHQPSGWQRLPSGLVIQWMTLAGSLSGYSAATFPVAFATACVAITNSFQSLSLAQTSVNINSITRTGFNFAAIQTGNYSAQPVSFIAIGY